MGYQIKRPGAGDKFVIFAVSPERALAALERCEARGTQGWEVTSNGGEIIDRKALSAKVTPQPSVADIQFSHRRDIHFGDGA